MLQRDCICTHVAQGLDPSFTYAAKKLPRTCRHRVAARLYRCWLKTGSTGKQAQVGRTTSQPLGFALQTSLIDTLRSPIFYVDFITASLPTSTQRHSVFPRNPPSTIPRFSHQTSHRRTRHVGVQSLTPLPRQWFRDGHEEYRRLLPNLFRPTG